METIDKPKRVRKKKEKDVAEIMETKEVPKTPKPSSKKKENPKDDKLKQKIKELDDLKEIQKELKKRIKEKEDEYKSHFQGESKIINWINKIFKKNSAGSPLDESLIKEILFMENELRETTSVIKEIKKLIKELE